MTTTSHRCQGVNTLDTISGIGEPNHGDQRAVQHPSSLSTTTSSFGFASGVDGFG